MEKEIKKDIWYYFKHLTSKTLHPDELTNDDLSGYSPYQMNKILSSIEIYIPVVAELSRFDLPKEVHYRFLYNMLPKKFIRAEYPKSSKKVSEDEKYVSEYFEFGTRDLNLAMRILDQDTIKKIKRKFGKL